MAFSQLWIVRVTYSLGLVPQASFSTKNPSSRMLHYNIWSSMRSTLLTSLTSLTRETSITNKTVLLVY